MHQQQAAMAKAEQQRKQQQVLIAQQQRQSAVPTQASKARARPATDPIVEEKISQLLNSMRQNSEATSNGDDDANAEGHGGHGRSRKDEEDMDEDERLLASEEGKKLSSKERRQLRNKVSARAFRSRRKEYIGQLEGEIATRVNENSELRVQNRELLSENKRLADLTRMLLSSPSFSGFLDTLSTNPNPVDTSNQQQQATPPAVEQHQQQQQEQTHAPKDPNPYAQQQQLDMNINYAILPDAAPLDFNLLDLNSHDFIYQPQVFSVHSVEEVSFDASVLSGKPAQVFDDEEGKVEMPMPLPMMQAVTKKEEAIEEEVEADEEFDSDPMFSLFAPSTSSAKATEAPLPLDTAALIAAIQPAKAMLEFELVDAGESERRFLRCQRLGAGIEAVVARLEGLGLE
ncbi:hypothetical protein V492_01803 [Pseudogymnoascus sp. VKM F-4246]|nr:hypothetical protein V492_01803 [Pseudogymnoascus sp. VKM F-4246]